VVTSWMPFPRSRSILAPGLGNPLKASQSPAKDQPNVGGAPCAAVLHGPEKPEQSILAPGLGNPLKASQSPAKDQPNVGGAPCAAILHGPEKPEQSILAPGLGNPLKARQSPAKDQPNVGGAPCAAILRGPGKPEHPCSGPRKPTQGRPIPCKDPDQCGTRASCSGSKGCSSEMTQLRPGSRSGTRSSPC